MPSGLSGAVIGIGSEEDGTGVVLRPAISI